MGGNVCAYGASNRPGTVHHMGNTTCHPGFLIYLSGSLWKFPPGRYRSGSTATAVDPHWTASCLGIWALPFSWRIHGVDPLGCRRYVDTLHAGHSCVAPDRHWANRTTTGIPPLRAHPLWTGRVMGSHHVWLVWSVWAVFCKSYPSFPIEYHQSTILQRTLRLPNPNVSGRDSRRSRDLCDPLSAGLSSGGRT